MQQGHSETQTGLWGRGGVRDSGCHPRPRERVRRRPARPPPGSMRSTGRHIAPPGCAARRRLPCWCRPGHPWHPAARSFASHLPGCRSKFHCLYFTAALAFALVAIASASQGTFGLLQFVALPRFFGAARSNIAFRRVNPTACKLLVQARAPLDSGGSWLCHASLGLQGADGN